MPVKKCLDPCIKCGKIDKQITNGLCNYCYGVEYRAKHGEKLAADKKEWEAGIKKTKIGQCSICGKNFPKVKSPVCQKCYNRDFYKRNQETQKEKKAKYRVESKDQIRKTNRKCNLKRNFKMSLEDYDSMDGKQEGKCAICSKTKEKNGMALAVDHCHKTGKIRELLCNRCNLTLGYYNDNHIIFEKMAEYLKKHLVT